MLDNGIFYKRKVYGMEILNVFKAAILGVVEGITEWLPISSTGHLILVDQFIKLRESAQFMEMFNVVIQLGAILAVVILYFHKLNPFAPSKSSLEKKETWSLWGKVIVACIPSAIIGLLFDDWLEAHFYSFVPVAIMLIVYGILFIVIENANKNRKPKVTTFDQLTIKTALIIGAFQVLALIPGTSRSGATILGAVLIGCSRYISAEFSFFLGIPTMLGASGLKLVKFFAEGNHFTGANIAVLLVGCIVSFVVSVIAIKFLMKFIKNHDFKPFGWYRIILGIILLVYWFFCMR